MKKILATGMSLALALSVSAFAAEANTTKIDSNLTANTPETKICEAIGKIGKVKDGKLLIDIDKVKTDKANPKFAKVNGVLIPDIDTFSYGVISGLCYSISTVEAILEVELAVNGLDINSFDPLSDKLQQKLQNLATTESYGVILGLAYKNPELLGAFIDKVKEKRFGKNTIGIPDAKDILVEGTYKKELTADEEKFVNEMVEKYLDALSKSPA